jgi:cellulose synthase/poly-beta-1,6-N-acetylglucosamine synthase-like glycosyltransferase
MVLFWLSLVAIAYPYAIYPVFLALTNRLGGRKVHTPRSGYHPAVTVLMPVHNERGRIHSKVQNLLALDYPADRLQILVIGDGCTDDSLEVAAVAGEGRVEVLALVARAGKAAALNAGLERARGEIIVFTDAGILLEPQALARLVEHFADPAIGCVSGEDYVEGAETEGLYGRLELLLRREEARLHSIAGASGCFYGQRRSITKPFVGGMAPDFLSVLVTVAAGQRALAEPAARGAMTATSNPRAEYARKVRTFLRGITALLGNAHLLNPFKYPAFSFILWSHKALRWLAPLFLVTALASAFVLRGVPLYAFFFWAQVAAYFVGALALLSPGVASRVPLSRLAAFFLLVNVAALQAVWLWIVGTRVEVWQPTRRPQ